MGESRLLWTIWPGTGSGSEGEQGVRGQRKSRDRARPAVSGRAFNQVGAERKRVVLIGDSIRMGYQSVVAEALKGEAEVWGPDKNGGDSQNVLAHLDEWAIGRKPDIIHINCGLHDIKKEFNSGGAQVPFEEYVKNVETILGRLKREAKCPIIWALTTPVNEQWHHDQKGFDRFEADVDAINDATKEICVRLDIPVNDLHSVVIAAGRDTLLVDDGVHFTTEGYEVLGSKVSDQLSDFSIQTGG